MTPRSIDDYIAGFPQDVQEKLQKIRATIRKAAPGAKEKISYQIPAFELDGKLIFFAGFKNHISVYPAPRAAVEFKEELAAYRGGKGTVQFPLDQPVPLDLIRRIVRFRVRTNTEAAAKRREGSTGVSKTRRHTAKKAPRTKKAP
jgi:uncharacterized protein YdhG (YjbR/CyaY superfamily)